MFAGFSSGIVHTSTMAAKETRWIWRSGIVLAAAAAGYGTSIMMLSVDALGRPESIVGGGASFKGAGGGVTVASDPFKNEPTATNPPALGAVFGISYGTFQWPIRPNSVPTIGAHESCARNGNGKLPPRRSSRVGLKPIPRVFSPMRSTAPKNCTNT